MSVYMCVLKFVSQELLGRLGQDNSSFSLVSSCNAERDYDVISSDGVRQTFQPSISFENDVEETVSPLIRPRHKNAQQSCTREVCAHTDIMIASLKRERQ